MTNAKVKKKSIKGNIQNVNDSCEQMLTGHLETNMQTQNVSKKEEEKVQFLPSVVQEN